MLAVTADLPVQTSRFYASVVVKTRHVLVLVYLHHDLPRTIRVAEQPGVPPNTAWKIRSRKKQQSRHAESLKAGFSLPLEAARWHAAAHWKRLDDPLRVLRYRSNHRSPGPNAIGRPPAFHETEGCGKSGAVHSSTNRTNQRALA